MGFRAGSALIVAVVPIASMIKTSGYEMMFVYLGWISDRIGRESTRLVAFSLEAVGILLLSCYGLACNARPSSCRQ
jgi:MFS family permease